MKKGLVLLLLFSLGLNAGLLWNRLRPVPARPGVPASGPGRFVGHPPEAPPWHCWLAEIGPRVRESRRRVERARLALRDALARPDVDTGEIRRRLAAVAAAQQELDSLVAFSLAGKLRDLPPRERCRMLDALPWSRRSGPGRRPGRPHLPRPPRSP